jgi:uncharacterized protein YbjT (DUF2867 family)
VGRVRTVFVTGGSGFVGRSVLRLLKAKGYGVRCLVRPGSGPTPGAERIEGSVWQPGRWMDSVRDCQGVILLAGIDRPKGEDTLERVNIQGIELATEAAKLYGALKIAHLSVLGASSEAQDEFLRTKWKGEELVRWAGPAYTLFRPSWIFGPGSPFVEGLKRLLAYPIVTPLAGGGGQRLQPVYVEDVARCVAACLDDPRTDGKEYELGGPEPLTVKQALAAVRESAHAGAKPAVPVPVGLVRASSAVVEAMLPERELLSRLSEDSVCDAGPADRMFGGPWTAFDDWCRGALS